MTQHAMPQKHILLVEDSIVNQMFVEQILLQMNYRVTMAENGESALTLLRVHKDIDAILMDCHMPVMDGFAATAVIRDKQKLKELSPMPIIALTALVAEYDCARCLSAGMDDYVAKPVRPENLAAVLSKWTGLRDQTHFLQPEMNIGFDAGAGESLRATFGARFPEFIETYLHDTETRLHNIGGLIADGADKQKILLHAHSISSSSMYVGLMQVADLASILEMEAGKAHACDARIIMLYDALRNAFAMTREVLVSH